MTHLTVHQLLPYFPYSLEFSGGGDTWTWDAITHEGIVLKNGLHSICVDWAVVGVEYRPMLKRFRWLKPGEMLNRVFLDTYDFALKSGEKHYDIFNLIPQGFAEEIKAE